MNIKQGLSKRPNQTKSAMENTKSVYFLLLLIALLVSPVVWISLFFISSSVLQNALMICLCIIMCSLFLKIADETPSIKNRQNKVKA